MAQDVNSIAQIDKNLEVKTVIEDGDKVFFDVKEAPFEVYGLYDYKNQTPFKRLPDELAKNVNGGVAKLYLNTAGGRVRFSTNSKTVTIKVRYSSVSRFPHMSLSGTAGFDLYIDREDGKDSKFHRTFVPPYDMGDTLLSEVKFNDAKQRFITIDMPSYSGVESFYVGIERGATLGHGVKYMNELPVVFYGSSITQGACSSRPGNIYQNIISRRMSLDYINLGFSGSGRAEDTIVDYMAKLPMCAFVSDYDHNAPNAAHLRATHCKMYEKIRTANPDIPYIILSRCDFNASYNDSVARREAILETYRFARANGDMNVYFIDGESIFCGAYEDMCTVEGTHPTDVGMALLADKIEATLRKSIMFMGLSH